MLIHYCRPLDSLIFQNFQIIIKFFNTIDYMNQLNKSVTSKYSGGLFVQSHTKDGLIYNVIIIFIL